MHHRTGALEAAHHPKVTLVAVEVRKEDHPRLVVLGGRLEYMTAQRDRRGQYLFVALGVPGVEGCERGGSGGRYGIEDAEEGVGEALIVPPDKLRVVEVVAGVHLDALREPPTHLHLPILVQQGRLYAVHLLGVVSDDREAHLHGVVKVAMAPVTFEGRVEHGPEPVEYHGVRDLREDTAVDLRVVLRRLGNGGEGAARHEDHLSSLALHELALLLVCG